ncbi:MAG: response regulator [Actinomycetota bacterium]
MATILLVDDNPVERRIVRMTLDMDGHRAAEASTGAEALEIIAKYPVDLVLLAMGLKDTNAYDVISQARTMPGREHTAIVAILESDDEKGPVESFMAGAVDLLIRPFGALDVREIVVRATTGEEVDRRRLLVGRQLEAFETAQRLQEQARASAQT